MTTYNFSTLTNGQTITFNPDVDYLIFDSPLYLTNELRINETVTGLTLGYSALSGPPSLPAKTVTLTGMTLWKLTGGPLGNTAAHVQFQNGGLLLVGDNSTAHDDDLSNFLVGSINNDMLFGLGGNDTLNGGAGSDVMVGGDGNDTYVVDNLGDVVSEAATVLGGIDAVQASISHTLATGVENLQLLTTSSINGTGNTLANRLTGNAGNNLLDGMAGADTMTGGDGNDTYIVESSGDTVIETNNSATQIDTVRTFISYTLGANVENLEIVGTATTPPIISAIGNTLANTLTGNFRDNFLDGRTGADTMIGGDGDDTYVVDDVGDTVSEASSSFTQVDTVQSFIGNYTLTANVENLRLMGSANLNGTGNAIDNQIFANSGDNILDGGGNPVSGGGNPVAYLYGSISAGVTHFGLIQGGGDTASYLYGATSGVTVSLAVVGPQDTEGSGIDTLSNFENLVGSAYDDNLTGNAGNNVLVGGYGGGDMLTGGDGNDTYIVVGSETVIETNAATSQIDTVLSVVNYRLGANVENLTLMDYTVFGTLISGSGGSPAINGTGNALNNVLKGNAAANVLDGRTGVDSMTGGGGNDTYIVENLADVVDETLSGGIDTVKALVNYTLGTNVENLQLMGTAGLSGTGNTLDNIIWANRGANLLDGGAGGDTLSYEFGASAGVTVDLGLATAQNTVGSGLDTLINFENLTGSSFGDLLSGNANKNILDGGLGSDTVSYASATAMVKVNLGGLTTTGTGTIGAVIDTLLNFENVTGSNFNDILIGTVGNNVFNGGSGGLDTVSYEYILATSGLSPIGVIVNLSLTTAQNTGVSGFDTLLGIENLTGSSLNDTLTGNAFDNVINGLSGADLMTGGDGNDTFVVDDVDDKAIETNAALTQSDTVLAGVDYTLSNYVEVLQLTGTANLNGTGNTQANSLIGNSGNNILDGKGGADTMSGGDGNDLYVVDHAGDVVSESNTLATQIDTVQFDPLDLALTAYTLTTNVENLQLMGTRHINGTGNNSNNILYANAGNNVLNGGLGTDTVSYQFISSGPVKVNLSLSTAQNTINAGSDTLINIENLTGTSFGDTLTGDANTNRLDGAVGSDTLTGGDGNDIYVVDDAGDQVIETSASGGTDLVETSVSYTLTSNVENLLLTGVAYLDGTGNTLANSLTGNSGNNTLNGLAGADTMAGGGGNDLYLVDHAGDVITESSGTGTGIDSVKSSVTYILGANVENLELVGSAAINATGNTLANALTGNSGNNVLDGLSGADTMTGGDGNDVYTVDNAADQVIETNNSLTQIDTVETSITYTLGANVENLKLTGTASINGTGNTLDNVISANALNNVLNGGIGIDTVSYQFATSTGVTVNLALTSAQTTGGSGSDTILNFENLTGSNFNDTLTGSLSANKLDGGLGNDLLNGGLDNDILTGGLGSDIIRFDTLLNASTNRDTITDFNVVDDTIQLENAIFTSLTTLGTLAATSFRSGAGIISAADANDYLIYNTTTGNLYYDADGSGAASTAVLFATLDTHPVLTSLDFMVT
ncbi:MAG: calcium-binding protein [Accumulibacter sp.]|uniref:beta strand repeat-containing protein n=1 Tax=Accumulibacter sp. TaxID=2053492 RepID=UPI003315D6CF